MPEKKRPRGRPRKLHGETKPIFIRCGSKDEIRLLLRQDMRRTLKENPDATETDVIREALLEGLRRRSARAEKAESSNT